MASGIICKIRDNLVNELIALNDQLNMLSPRVLHSPQAREEVQKRRESIYSEIKHHRAKGHDGKPCPAVQHVRW